MMNLNDLRYFCETAKWENVSQASKILHVSQPALSKTLHKLQEELGVSLFTHVGRRIELSDLGKEYYQKIAEAIKIIDEANKSIQVNKQSYKGTVSVLILTARSIMPKFIVAFQKKYPGINLELTNVERSDKFNLVSYDYCITDMPKESNAMDGIQIPLCNEEFMACFSSNSRFSASKGTISLREISEERLLTPWKGYNLISNVRKVFKEAGVAQGQIFECNDVRTLIALVKENMGVSLMPISTRKELEDNGLSIRYVEENCCFRTIYLMYDRERQLSDEARVFQDEIVDFFSTYSFLTD